MPELPQNSFVLLPNKNTDVRHITFQKPFFSLEFYVTHYVPHLLILLHAVIFRRSADS